MTWHKQTVLLHLPSPRVSSSLLPFWMLSVLLMWFMQFTTPGLEYSSCHVQFNVLIHTPTHTHRHTFPSWRQISALKFRWHGYVVRFYFCLSLSCWCVLPCVCVCVCLHARGDARVIQIAPDYSEANGSRGLGDDAGALSYPRVSSCVL